MKLLAFTASFYDKDYDSKLEKLTYTCEALDIDLVTYGHHEFFSFYDSKFVVSGERNCHPFGHLADKFPQAPTSYRFMNPGNFIGEIEYMLFVINQLKAFR